MAAQEVQFDYARRMSRSPRAARPARTTRQNPNLLVQDSDYTANTLNADAAVYATLNQYQLWNQANGGDQWAAWELERRGITELPARPNPQGMNMQMILSESNLTPREPGLGGEWARWAEDREGSVRRNPKKRRNSGGKRIIHNSSGCTGRGYWLSVVELDEGRHVARVLYNDRRDDFDVHDPYPTNADRYVKPPGEHVYFNMDRGLDDIGNKVVLGGYSPIVNGVTQALIPRSEYPIEGPFFVRDFPGVAGNEWRRNPHNLRPTTGPDACSRRDGSAASTLMARARNNHHIPVGSFGKFTDGRGYFFVTGPARRPAADDPTEAGMSWPGVEKFYPGITVQRGHLGGAYAWKTDAPDDDRYLQAIQSISIPESDMVVLRKVAKKYGHAKINPHTSQGMSVTACNADEDHEEWANWALNREGILHRNPRTKFGVEGGYFNGSEDGYMYRGYIEVEGKRKYPGGYSSDKRDALNMARREAQRADVTQKHASFKIVPKGGTAKWRYGAQYCDSCGEILPEGTAVEYFGMLVCSDCAKAAEDHRARHNPGEMDYDVLLVRKDDDGGRPAVFAVLRRSTVTPAALSKYGIGGERGTVSAALTALDRASNATYGDKDRSSPYYLWRVPGAQGATTFEEKRAALTAPLKAASWWSLRNPSMAAFVGGGRGLAVRDLISVRSRTSGSGGSGPKGGYSPAERKELPTGDFLVPERRAWPVGDLNHAFIALQYMAAGRGRAVEYPLLLQRLAKLWPVQQNKALWRKYGQLRIKIQRQCECRLPSATELG